jgi:hydrogenase maturation protein HypF
MGRLFDTAAALLGFTRETSFEGQAAMWLEHLAKSAATGDAYPFPDMDFRPLLAAIVRDRVAGRPAAEIARAFQRGVAQGLGDSALGLSRESGVRTLVLSGGVFQNDLLLADIKSMLKSANLQIWTNSAVPPNDGGISLGQAALAVFSA